MNVTLSLEFENLVNEKLLSGEFRSADEVVDAALRLFKEREDDRAVLRLVNSDEALPADARFSDRLERLFQEADDSGADAELTEQDWDDIRRAGLVRLEDRKPD